MIGARALLFDVEAEMQGAHQTPPYRIPHPHHRRSNTWMDPLADPEDDPKRDLVGHGHDFPRHVSLRTPPWCTDAPTSIVTNLRRRSMCLAA
mmetsp:Transcript_8399/g.15751  ORF Transcript_8399/g.15751 Transcript_8399/m.15751 type:complete len:92 (-) Transcript_8399:504-779(-)